MKYILAIIFYLALIIIAGELIKIIKNKNND